MKPSQAELNSLTPKKSTLRLLGESFLSFVGSLFVLGLMVIVVILFIKFIKWAWLIKLW
jgi:hypothetical protein